MKMGEGTYNAASLADYLRDLSQFRNFKFVIIVDDRNQFVAYIPGRYLKRANDLGLPDFNNLINAVNNGDRAALVRIPGVLTDCITTRTSNAEALRMMEKYGLDAIPVVDENTKQVRAITDCNRILSHMLLALTEADKV
jgi:CBS domain-containing protein